ncbi:pyridoxamine 5'-phosphate oxidase [Prevotella sp. 10(H)]|uniref:pyridoxamine 5'-phosphate oxidase n=1 Tax=Prevotella sp. 10(H) TaxID=1158294 RepID=UPI0004A71BE1|nr:pyridoxamine 5'-phosphate oxidase [Prevotella sp. 10(H)]
MTDLFNIRRDFSLKTLDESEVTADPIKMFTRWFDEAMTSQALEPNAMNLATADKDGRPSSRIVLLKQVKPEGFVFFTNYNSRKAVQLAENNYCALDFVWHELERQVRIEGTAEKISPAESDSYFEMRPEKSKLGAWASPQSRPIPNREYLERMMSDFESEFTGKDITRPDNWGGYIVKPYLIEFWQGRKNRLHDRIQYSLEDGVWEIVRLAP